MTRRESFLAALGIGTPTERRERKSHRARHAGDKLYHGPLRIPAAVTARAATGPIYKTTHYHPVIRIEHDGVVYLWRCAPVGEGDYLGEVVRTPTGDYRVHLYRAISLEWRGEPKTPLTIISRYWPDPEIPQVTIEQEREHFLGSASDGCIYPGVSADGRLMPPVAASAVPLWQREE